MEQPVQTLPTETPISPPPAPEAPKAPPKKERSTQAEVNKALEEMAKNLLEKQDPRGSIVALARLAGTGTPTDLGNELRYNVITALQKDGLATNVTLEKPETNAMEKFLDQRESGKIAKAELELVTQAKRDITLEQLHAMVPKDAALREQFFKELGVNLPPEQPIMPNETTVKTFGNFLQSSLGVGFAGIMLLQFGMSLAQDSSHGGH